MAAEDRAQNRDSGALAAEIADLAAAGDFSAAESLREQLMESDPMNLSLIVSTGEVIEREKSKRLDPDHLAIWEELYRDFSEEERNGLFYSLDKALVSPGKLLVKQGLKSNRLFFIESGRVTLFYRKKDKNIAVLQLGRGDLLGEDTFFEISLCPLSAAAQTEVTVRYLNRDEAEKWNEHHPGLYQKLGDYCRLTGKGTLAVQQKNLNRRDSPRYPVKGTATVHILDKQGRRMNAYFKGGLLDISRAGLCFGIKCSKQATARALLAREVDVEVAFDRDSSPAFRGRGMVVKASFLLHNDYHLHIKLADLIPEEMFAAFPCDWQAEDGKRQ